MGDLTLADSRGLPWLEPAWRALPALRARGVHAVLLHGAAGIGKKPLALAAARAWLCAAPQADGHACGRCAECALTAAGSHPDLRVIVPDVLAHWRPAAAADDGEEAAADDTVEDAGADERRETRGGREIRIEQVRELLDFVNVASHRAGLRVVVLAPAEALNAPAANALLKMLEEPTAGIVFVIVADALDRVLPTIRSRCVLQPVAAPGWGQALDWLRRRGIDAAGARLAAAGGRPLAAAGEDDPELAQERAVLVELLAAGGRLTPEAIAARLPRKPQLGAAVAALQRWGWDLLAQRAAGCVRYHPTQPQRLAELAQSVSLSALLGWLATLQRRQAVADHPLNTRLALEELLLEYSRLWMSSAERSRS